MGNLCSKPDVFTGTGIAVDGDGKAFQNRFKVEKVLGSGEFGEVKLVQEKEGDSSTKFAMKELQKGFTFKDNILYTPLKPEQLQTECECLRVLNGDEYNLKLVAVYESRSVVYIVTELCSGGEMFEYLSSGPRSAGLRTEDISRISYQLLSAVNHCAKHSIVHRDIKPENIMFVNNSPGAELRLIDFGCATKDNLNSAAGETAENIWHETFAGTPFYLSPEMYQRKYQGGTTDVWAVGVTLYVLVAGYPADCLQAAFDKLQTRKRNLRNLENLPDNMPDSYYEMLEGLLAYSVKERKTAGEMLDCEFAVFHKELLKAPSSDDASKRGRIGLTASVLFPETGKRHGALLGYKKYEMAVTTVLATVPTKKELGLLLMKFAKYEKPRKSDSVEEEESDSMLGFLLTKCGIYEKPSKEGGGGSKLEVLTIKDLKATLVDLGFVETYNTIEKLKSETNYDDFAYDVSRLRIFAARASGSSGEENDQTKSNKAGRASMFLPKKIDGGKPEGRMRRSAAV